MFTKKLLLKTFGAKIAPYGFEYAGIEAGRRYHFKRIVEGKEQTFIIQRDGGSFQLFIYTACVERGPEIRDIFWDLTWHRYRDDEELENILNTLGDHVVRRVIPMLPELSIPKPEYAYSVTEDMYMRLEQDKEELLQRFMERYRIDGIHESDIVMEKLLRELERIKDMPFPETIETQIELAAVWGYIIIRDVGGEWVKVADAPRLEIRNCSVISNWENPLEAVSHCCQKGGGAALAKRYVTLVGEHRKRVVAEKRIYGSNWEPPRTSNIVDEGLLSEDIVKNVLTRNLADIGFCYEQEIGRSWWLKKGSEDEAQIQIAEEGCHRKSFFVTLYQYRDRQVEYMYKKFCCYEDEAELREQLETVSNEIKEAALAGHQIENPRYRHSYACHVTEEMDHIFRAEEKEMAERFWKRNGLEQTSEEAEILRCIAREIDSMAWADYGERRAAYEENKRQLMELAAAYGELLIREIGGRWSVDEEFRMKRNHMYLEDVPVVDIISLPTSLIRHWEYGGSESFLRAHQEYKWKYEEWKRLCYLADIAV